MKVCQLSDQVSAVLPKQKNPFPSLDALCVQRGRKLNNLTDSNQFKTATNAQFFSPLVPTCVRTIGSRYRYLTKKLLPFLRLALIPFLTWNKQLQYEISITHYLLASVRCSFFNFIIAVFKGFNYQLLEGGLETMAAPCLVDILDSTDFTN